MNLSEEIENQLKELSGIDKRIAIESQIITRNQLLIAITIDKSMINIESFEPLDIIRFVLLLKPDYPNTPPILYCLTRFCLPELCDGRDLLEDTLQMKWDSDNCFLKLIISQIPSFIQRYLSYYNNNKNEIVNRKLFGRYYLDSIYELSIIKYIPYLYFDVISEVFGNPEKKTKMKLEDRKILITDNFLLLFCNKSLYELDQLRLIFVGPITSLVHIRQLVKNGMILLKWMIKGKGLINQNFYQMQLKTQDGDYIVDTLIENLSRRSIQFKVTNKINSNVKREGSVPLVDINTVEEEIKKIEKKIINKEDITKDNISMLVSLYEKAIQYYSALNDDRFEICIKKLHNIYSNNEYTSLLNMKTISKDNNQYNVTQFKRKRKKRSGNEEKKKKEKKIKKKPESKIENLENKEINQKVENNNNTEDDKKKENTNNINNDNEQKIDENKNEIKNEENITNSDIKNNNESDNNININKNNDNIINDGNNNKEEKKGEEKIEKKDEKEIEKKEENKTENKKENKKKEKKKESKKDTKENRPKRTLRKREEGNRVQRKNRNENDKKEGDLTDDNSQRMFIDKKELEEMIKNELNMGLSDDKDKEKTEIKTENNKDEEANLKDDSNKEINNK